MINNSLVMNDNSNESLSNVLEKMKGKQLKYFEFLKNKKNLRIFESSSDKIIKLKSKKEKNVVIIDSNDNKIKDESKENCIRNIYATNILKEKILDADKIKNLLASIGRVNAKFYGHTLPKLEPSKLIFAKKEEEANTNIEDFSYKILEFDNVEDRATLLVYEKAIPGEKKTDIIEIKGCDYKKLQTGVYLNDTMIWFHLR